MLCWPLLLGACNNIVSWSFCPGNSFSVLRRPHGISFHSVTSCLLMVAGVLLAVACSATDVEYIVLFAVSNSYRNKEIYIFGNCRKNCLYKESSGKTILNTVPLASHMVHKGKMRGTTNTFELHKKKSISLQTIMTYSVCTCNSKRGY